MTDRRRCIVVDVESTGLEVQHQATEVAWYDLSTDEYGVFIPPHSLEGADPFALQIHGYAERIAGMPVDDGTEQRLLHDRFGSGRNRSTIICANPSFDTEKVSALFARSGLTPTDPWHHRKINVSEGAYWLFPDQFPDGEQPGLKAVADLLGVPLPGHHSALDDVMATVEVYRRLERLRGTVQISGLLDLMAVPA